MKKMDKINLLLESIGKMQWLMDICKVQMTIPEDLSKVKSAHLVEAIDWLTEVYDEYLPAARVRRSVTEEMWKRYEMAGINDLQEILLWETKSVAFRKKVRSALRPPLFIKSKHKTILTGGSNEANKESSK